VLPSLVELHVNSYEVVFKDPLAGGGYAPYYRGTGTAKDGYLKVWVLPGRTYEVLLLGGKGNILLAAGYDDTVEIKAGEANTVSITLEPIPLQWDTQAANVINTTGTAINHFAFKTSIDSTGSPAPYDTGYPAVVVGSRYVNLAPVDKDHSDITKYGVGAITPDSTTFTVQVSLAGLGPLIKADIHTDTSSTKLTIEAARVRLWPRYLEENFNPVDLVSTPTPPGTVDTANPIAFVNAPSGTANQLPNWDVDTVLQCDLKYYAFGTILSGGTPWIIRNGIDGTEDDTPSGETPNKKSTIGSGTGGFIVVKIGQGSPEELQEVTVIPSWW
jgi:hypothetical protein